jgi:hypothetical protein
MRVLFVAVAFAAIAQPCLAAEAVFSGVWKGGYIAADGGDANFFDVELTQSGSTVTGTAIETNVFGDGDVLFLTSRLSGTVTSDKITFVKTYDGSGGVSHSVTYYGQMDATGRRVQGRYDAGGVQGSFEMAR